MITLITGLPGACKTLYTLAYVKALSEKENRPVFYAGIKDLMLPWTEIDATKWMECPNGAFIVIDECQTVFRPRSFGANIPDYVARLETHRHQGFDIFLITQHPMLCDPSIRRLAGRHLHAVRKFGMQAATLHEWNSVRENCDKPAGRADSIKHHWKYDKKAYGYYKSAEVHTVKRNIPFRVVVLFVILPAAIAFLGYRFYGSVKSRATEASAPVQNAPGQTSASAAMAGPRPAAYLNPVEDAKQFVFDRTPRVTGLPHTAPRYDKVTEPTTAPMPVACLSAQGRCKCYTQQATVMDTPEDTCRAIVADGFFQDFDNDKDGVEKTRRSEQVLNRDAPLPLSRVSTRDRPPSFNAADGYGVLGKAGPGVRVPAL